MNFRWVSMVVSSRFAVIVDKVLEVKDNLVSFLEVERVPQQVIQFLIQAHLAISTKN